VNEYRTVYEPAEVETIEKKSRFIASLKNINSEEEANNFINQIKSKYWDATHNVYAYILDNNIQRYSDDGEPQGTAGIPVLQTIKSLELNNIIIVVTRYFGGTLLGANGLIRAYSKSAKEGITNNKLVTIKLCILTGLTIDYYNYGRVQSYFANTDQIIFDTVFEENVQIKLLISESDKTKIEKELTDILSYSLTLNNIGHARVTLDSSNKLLDTYLI
jgi:uncharacterized YigZ family protein